jgi:hypothetical protein
MNVKKLRYIGIFVRIPIESELANLHFLLTDNPYKNKKPRNGYS